MDYFLDAKFPEPPTYLKLRRFGSDEFEYRTIQGIEIQEAMRLDSMYSTMRGSLINYVNGKIPLKLFGIEYIVVDASAVPFPEASN